MFGSRLIKELLKSKNSNNNSGCNWRKMEIKLKLSFWNKKILFENNEAIKRKKSK